MNTYNFDKPINRYGTNCIKFDFKCNYKKPEDVFPMWVADMDFEVPQEITDAIITRAGHRVYGYTVGGESYDEAVISWMHRRHGFEVQREWMLQTPGVVFGMVMAIRALTKPNDSVMIQTPVYYPFYKSVKNNGRNLVTNSLVYDKEEERYVMDFEALEQSIITHNVKLFILCNPHNPVGRVWRKEELIKLGDILMKHNVLVVSDEIHMDFTFAGHKHLVFASLKEEYKEVTVTCTAPSKTFNLAGLQISNIIIANENIRKRVQQEIENTGYDEPNIFGIEACKAAYLYGDAYVDELNEYVEENVRYITRFLEEKLPTMKVIPPEGTYLLWIDFNGYGLSKEELEDRIVARAKLWFNPGEVFGIEGCGFERVNIATSRCVVQKALEQLYEAFGDLEHE